MAEEEPILFVECSRDDAKGAVISELRANFNRGVGLGGDLVRARALDALRPPALLSLQGGFRGHKACSP